MAIQIQLGDILAVRVWTSFGPQAAVNTYNFRCLSLTGASVTDQDVADSFVGYMGTYYAAVCSNEVRYCGVQVYFVRRAAGTFLPPPVKSTSGAGNCTGGPDSLPRNTAMILHYFSLVRRGPGGRGRVFIPFVSTNGIGADGAPTSAINTLSQGFVDGLVADTIIGSGGNTATFSWIILRRKPTIDFTLIGAAGPTGKFGQQHKRGDYGRPNVSPI